MSAVLDAGAMPAPELAAARRPTWRLLRNSLGLWRTRAGLAIVLVLVGIAVIGPSLAPHAPTAFVGQPRRFHPRTFRSQS